MGVGPIADETTRESSQYLPITNAAAQYVSQAATIRLWAANSFMSRTGSPALSQRNTVPMWLLDGAATEDICAIVAIPSTWTTYDVKVRYLNAGAGSGDVRWTYLKGDLPADDNATAATSSVGNTTSTAGATDVLKTHTLASAVAVPASGITVVHLRRIGGDALDTLANDIGVLYVDVVKAS